LKEQSNCQGERRQTVRGSVVAGPKPKSSGTGRPKTKVVISTQKRAAKGEKRENAIAQWEDL